MYLGRIKEFDERHFNLKRNYDDEIKASAKDKNLIDDFKLRYRRL